MRSPSNRPPLGAHDPAGGVDEPGGDVTLGQPANCFVAQHDCRCGGGVRSQAGGAGGRDCAPPAAGRLTGAGVNQVVPYDAITDPPSGGRAGGGQPTIGQVLARVPCGTWSRRTARLLARRRRQIRTSMQTRSARRSGRVRHSAAWCFAGDPPGLLRGRRPGTASVRPGGEMPAPTSRFARWSPCECRFKRFIVSVAAGR